MAATFTDLKKGIYDWILGATGVAPIWRWQKGVFKKPGFSIMITSSQKIGHDVETNPNGSGVSSIHGHREFVLNIEGYSDYSYGIYEKTLTLRDSLSKLSVRNALGVKGVVVFDWQPVQDISGIDNSENEQRSIFDVNCRHNIEIVDNVSFIDIVNSQGTFHIPPQADYIQTFSVDNS
jgi:hypothetical protein